MRICHFSSSPPEGHYYQNLAAGLNERGCELAFVQLYSGHRPEWLKAYPEIDFVSLGLRRRAATPIAAIRLAEYLREQRVDIIHTHLFDAGLVAAISKYIYKKPIYVYMRHHTSVVRMLGSKFHVGLDKWMAERADIVLAVSETAKAYIKETDRVRNRVEALYLGFDFRRFAPDLRSRKAVREELGVPEDGVVIGYIANFLPGKGHADLLEAFSLLAGEHRELRLLFVGSGDFKDLIDIAAKSGLADKLYCAGWRPDIPGMLNAMDIFVQPSHSEAFSQVIVEAMGVGLPVVATDVGSAREVITNGETGLVVSPGKIEELAGAIKGLVCDPNYRAKLAEAGKRSVVERFSFERMAEEHYRLYLELIAERL